MLFLYSSSYLVDRTYNLLSSVTALADEKVELTQQLEDMKGSFNQKVEDHSRLCDAIVPLREMLGIEGPVSVDERVTAVESMPRLVHDLAVKSLRFGIKETLAITRSHYDDADLGAISRGFPQEYDDDQLDAFEREASPLAEELAQRMKEDSAFPCPPIDNADADA